MLGSEHVRTIAVIPVMCEAVECPPPSPPCLSHPVLGKPFGMAAVTRAGGRPEEPRMFSVPGGGSQSSTDGVFLWPWPAHQHCSGPRHHPSGCYKTLEHSVPATKNDESR